MAFHRSLQITEDLRRIFNSKTGEMLDNVIPDFVQPVIPVTPVCKIVRDTVNTNQTATTIFTTSATKDFYLVAASLSLIRTVGSPSTQTRITVVINGIVRRVLQIAGITLQVQEGQLAINFNPPIKVDRGTNIQTVNTSGTGTIVVGATITGYEVESDSSPQT